MAENLSNSTNSEELYSAVGEVGVKFGGDGARNEAGLFQEGSSNGLFGMIVFFCYMFVALFAWLAPFGEAEIFPVPFAPWDETMFSAPIRSVVISSHV